MVSKKASTEYYPTAFVIFGITGDLGKRKLIPAIYHLFKHSLLPEDIRFIGVSHKDWSSENFTEYIKESVNTFVPELNRDVKDLETFANMFVYHQGDFTAADTYERLKTVLEAEDEACEMPHQAIFYMATAPQFFVPIVEQLNLNKMTGACSKYGIKAKVVIEKPFGHDFDTAQELNTALLQYAAEEQIYRMDHYLGKETVQNLLLFRFTNPIVNDTWSPEGIDHIQITAAEDLGVEQRAAYYNGSGALRDMIQSHCLALLTLAMMDEPYSLESADIHMRKEQILKSLELYNPTDIEKTAVRGQYEHYLSIPDVPDDSVTETYAAIRLQSRDPKWAKVPIFIQTGKRMKKKATTISVHFSPCKSDICSTQGIRTAPNVLKIRVQPEESIVLRLYAKTPGFETKTERVDMEFSYRDNFEEEQPSPYERLIHDVIIGDQALFPSTTEVMEQWRIIQPILDAWEKKDIPMHKYEQNSWGPEESEDFIAQHGTRWHT